MNAGFNRPLHIPTGVAMLALMTTCMLSVLAAAHLRAQDRQELELLFLTDTPLAPDRIGRGMPLPPQTTVVRGTAGSSGSIDHYTVRVGFESSLSVAAIGTHYERQLVAAGWTAEARGLDGERMAATRYRRKSDGGVEVGAILVATTLAPQRVDVSLRVVRIKSARATPTVSTSGAKPAATRTPGAGAGVRPVPGVSPEFLAILYDGPLSAGAGDPIAARAGLDPTFPPELLPDGSKIAASAVSKTYTTIVGEAPLGIPAVPRFVIGVRRNGWTLPYPPRIGGFTHDDVADVELCKGSLVARLQFRGRESGTFFRAAVSGLASDNCSRPAPRDGGPAEWGVSIALPLLVTPRGASMAPSGGGGGIESAYYEARLRVTTPLLTVVDQYARQMAAAGWKLEGRVDAPSLSVTRYSSASLSGNRVTAFLTLTPMSSNADLDAWFRAVRQPGQ
jgi:hypothetical protein